ncbi:MAG TPA: MFS transporter, partial [Flavisolibacter sp.]|nr:MFS transporter [Flavisolibacter sp.]
MLIFSQFAGTSLWFAGNAIIDQLSASANGANVTSYVQFGFIGGTLVFSLLTIADRFAAKNVFFFSSVMAALANVCIIPLQNIGLALPLLRFVTGFFLAGIYPVGMKIAADLFPRKLGKALGLLVGALVLGTSFPHFVRSLLGGLNWQAVLITTSLLAFLGGLAVYLLIPSTHKKAASRPDFAAAFSVFRSNAFRSAAFGYFGHMWELYAFWSILPTLFLGYHSMHHMQASPFLWSFLVIAAGSLGCAGGGLLSMRWGSKKVAFTALLLSGICCLTAPLAFQMDGTFFYPFVLVWGITVAADSPQFSAMVASAADDKIRGTALTIVTCIGFAITIVSIQGLKTLFAG